MLAAPTRCSRRVWLVAFLLVAGLGLAWLAATPVFASPDEPAQVIRAVALAHGQLLGAEFGPGNVPPDPVPIDKQPWRSGLAVSVPAVYQHWGNVNCVVFNLFPPATADCLRFSGPRGDARALTYVARYQPAYPVILGLVTRPVPAGRGQVYAMRVLTVLLGAALLASALVTALSALPRLALLGVAAALTPMTLFLLASVNAQALEIAAGVAVWVHGLALALAPPGRVDRRVLDRLGIAAVVLVLVRPGSVLWLALAAAVVGLLSGWRRVRELWRERRARVWTAVVVAAVGLDVAWFAYADTLNARRTFLAFPVAGGTATILGKSFGKEYSWLRQMVGVFGWLDTPAPVATFVLWLLVLGVLLLAARRAGRRFLVPLGAIALAGVLVPVAYQVSLAHSIGLFWQGRYLLPFAVGLPILASVAAAPRWRAEGSGRGLVVGMVAALAVAHFLAFWEGLRRYAVGIHGPVFFFASARWEPPVPAALLLGTFAVLLGVAGWALSAAATPRPAPTAA